MIRYAETNRHEQDHALVAFRTAATVHVCDLVLAAGYLLRTRADYLLHSDPVSAHVRSRLDSVVWCPITQKKEAKEDTDNRRGVFLHHDFRGRRRVWYRRIAVISQPVCRAESDVDCCRIHRV